MKKALVSFCLVILMTFGAGACPAGAATSAQEQEKLEVAMEHFGASRYGAAVQLARELIASSTDSETLSEAEAIVVLSFLSQGDFERARREVQILLSEVKAKRPESPEVGELEGLLKQVNDREANYRKAVEQYEALIRAHPDRKQEAEAQFGIAETEFRFGRVEASARAYRKVMQDYPETEYGRRAMRRLPVVYELGGMPEKVAEACAEVIARAPDSKEAASAVDKLKQTYLRVRDYGEAAAGLRELAVRYRGTQSGLMAQYGLGEIYQRQGEIERVQIAYREIIDIAPSSPLAVQAVREIAKLYAGQKQYHVGVQRLQDIMRTHAAVEVAPCAGYLIGHLHQLAGDLRRADELYATVIARYPRSRWALEAENAITSR
jgi:TolA-binding protein